MVCIYLILAFIILMGYLVRNNNHIKKDVEKEIKALDKEYTTQMKAFDKRYKAEMKKETKAISNLEKAKDKEKQYRPLLKDYYKALEEAQVNLSDYQSKMSEKEDE